MRRVLLAFCGWCLLCACATVTAVTAQAYEPITAIHFLGNITTKEVVMRQEMSVTEGDPADPRLIEASRQAIMNLGLFKSVEARLLPEAQGPVLEITVREKFYFLPLPQLERNDEGDISYGGEVRFDNLYGYNQGLKVVAQITDRADGTEEREASFNYTIPRIPGSRYGIRSSLGYRQDVENVQTEVGLSGDYERDSGKFSFAVTRWLLKRAPSQGWRGEVGASWALTDYALVSGDAGLRHDGLASSVGVAVEYTAVNQYEFNRGGLEYGAALTQGAPAFGGGEDYQRLDLYRREYWSFGQGRHLHNLNSQFRLGYARNTSALANAFSLGGGGSLRGYKRESFTGDAYVLANIEYLTSFFGYRRMRGVVFVDSGNAYPAGAIDLRDLKSATGIGLRWKFPALVRVDLRADVAYALNDGEGYRFYFGTSHTF